MQMEVTFDVAPDGALILDVVSDDFATHDQFWNGDGIRTAMQGLDQSINAGTDIRVVQAFENHKRNGGEIEVRIRRFDGTVVPPRPK